MLKSFLILFIFAVSLLIVFLAYEKYVVLPKSQLNPQAEVLPKQEIFGLELIEEVNLKNQEIKNFSCQNVNVFVHHSGFKLKLTGSLNYEKSQNLNMEVKSIFGNEFLMGSNSDEFWFWSKRLKPLALYHAKHEDYSKTRLKTVFNPIIVMDSLGFRELKLHPGVAVKERENDVVLVEKIKNSIGQIVGHMTFIDKKEKRIKGFMITDQEGTIIASSEIVEYRNNLPYQILYTWQEEDQAMLIELPDSQVNTSIDSNKWKRPHYQNEIDMGKTVARMKWEFFPDE